MLLRRVVALLAFVGVLVHSAAIVRHHGIMTARASEAALVAMLTDLGVICHTETSQERSSSTATSSTATGDGSSSPSNNAQSCPICSGLASAFLLSPPIVPVVAVSLPLGVTYDLRPDQRLTQLKRIRPQGRGPSSLA